VLRRRDKRVIGDVPFSCAASGSVFQHLTGDWSGTDARVRRAVMLLHCPDAAASVAPMCALPCRYLLHHGTCSAELRQALWQVSALANSASLHSKICCGRHRRRHQLNTTTFSNSRRQLSSVRIGWLVLMVVDPMPRQAGWTRTAGEGVMRLGNTTNDLLFDQLPVLEDLQRAIDGCL
jgi:hypothetical protein